MFFFVLLRRLLVIGGDTKARLRTCRRACLEVRSLTLAIGQKIKSKDIQCQSGLFQNLLISSSSSRILCTHGPILIQKVRLSEMIAVAIAMVGPYACLRAPMSKTVVLSLISFTICAAGELIIFPSW